MSTGQPPAPPRLEARVEALERLSLAMHGRIAELGQDMQASFRQVADEQLQMETRLSTRINEVKETVKEVWESVDEVKGSVEEVSGSIEEVKASIANLEARMLSAFNDLLMVVKANVPPPNA